jgi:hypothetical protein
MRKSEGNAYTADRGTNNFLDLFTTRHVSHLRSSIILVVRRTSESFVIEKRESIEAFVQYIIFESIASAINSWPFLKFGLPGI